MTKEAKEFYWLLVCKRAGRLPRSFINDRGFRHINNKQDKIGWTYAFWLLKENKNG